MTSTSCPVATFPFLCSPSLHNSWKALSSHCFCTHLPFFSSTCSDRDPVPATLPKQPSRRSPMASVLPNPSLTFWAFTVRQALTQLSIRSTSFLKLFFCLWCHQTLPVLFYTSSYTSSFFSVFSPGSCFPGLGNWFLLLCPRTCFQDPHNSPSFLSSLDALIHSCGFKYLVYGNADPMISNFSLIPSYHLDIYS